MLPEPDRADNGYRDYGPETIDRLRFVRDAQATGLSLTEISSILDLRGHGETTTHRPRPATQRPPNTPGITPISSHRDPAPNQDSPGRSR